MKSLTDQMSAYGAYHQDTRNKLTHFVGVPLVTFAILLFMSWFRFVAAPELPLTAATVFALVVLTYYLFLDWQVALVQAPFTLGLWWLADRVAFWDFPVSFMVFAATFVGGWIIQLLGHGIEGKRPALADNFLQLFNAPLFLTTEVLLYLGFRPDLRSSVQATAPEPMIAVPNPEHVHS